MKKQAITLLLALSMGALAGCGHEHTYSSKWSYNKNGHYHVCECGEHDKIRPHEFGKWYTKEEPTRDDYGVAERKCEVCSYKEHKQIEKLVYKLIEIYQGDTKVDEVRTNPDGDYVLEVPEDEDGAYFAGYFDSENNPFPISGNIDEDVAIQLHVSENPYEIANEAALETALKASVRTAVLSDNITISKTHYVLSSITISSNNNNSITRESTFGGDMFVVGIDENYHGVSTETNPVSFTLKSDTYSLVVDGNKNEMTVDVVGSVFFVADMAELNLSGNVVFTNNKKVGNERVLPFDKETGEIQRITEAAKVGGSVIISVDSTININGPRFTYNEVNRPDAYEDKKSSYGGVIFSEGPLNILDGSFTNNKGSHGSCVYSLRKSTVTKANFEANEAFDYAAFYIADSQYSNVFMEAEELGDIVFKDNTAESSGGAIFVASKGTLEAKKVQFKSNIAATNGGAINTSGILTCEDCEFQSNSCSTKGGAVYAYYGQEEDGLESSFASFKSTLFKFNTGGLGGAIGLGSKLDGDLTEYKSYVDAQFDNCTFTSNSAVKKGTQYGNGGVIYTQCGAHFTVNNSTISNNSSAKYGGVFYGSDSLTVGTFKNTIIGNNSAVDNGGALYATGSSLVTIENVTATLNSTQSSTGGGFMYATGKAKVVINSITSTYNSADNGKGGFIYITTTGTELWIYAGSTTDCSAKAAANKNIYSNSSGAKIYIKGTDSKQYFDYDDNLFAGKDSGCVINDIPDAA